MIRCRNASSSSPSTRASSTRTGSRGPRGRASLAVDPARDVLDVVGVRRPRTAAGAPVGGAAMPCSGKKCGSRAATMPSQASSRRGDGPGAGDTASTGRGRARRRAGARRMTSATRLRADQVAVELAVDVLQERRTSRPGRPPAAGRPHVARPDDAPRVRPCRRSHPRCPWSRRCTRGGGRAAVRLPIWRASPRSRTRRRRGGRRSRARPRRGEVAARRRRHDVGRLARFVRGHIGIPAPRKGRSTAAATGWRQSSTVSMSIDRRGSERTWTGTPVDERSRSRWRSKLPAPYSAGSVTFVGRAITLVPSRRRSGTRTMVPGPQHVGERLRVGRDRRGRSARARRPCRRACRRRRRSRR